MIKNFGLKKTAHDPRDYSYHRTFGASNFILPDEYFAGRPAAKNQMLSQMCTAFASAVVGACEDGVDFCPEYSFAVGKLISKTGLEEPEDLRTPLKAAVAYGYLPSDPTLPSVVSQSAAYCANIANYAPLCADKAAKYKKKSYFRVDGNFKTIKQVLYNNAPSKRAILTGVLWMNEWTVAPKGIVPSVAVEVGGLHCVPIIGFTKIDGIEYIAVQNSYGEGLGDRGIFYFNEQVFNKCFDQPMYMEVEPDGIQPSPIGNWFSVLLYNLFKR